MLKERAQHKNIEIWHRTSTHWAPLWTLNGPSLCAFSGPSQFRTATSGGHSTLWGGWRRPAQHEPTLLAGWQGLAGEPAQVLSKPELAKLFVILIRHCTPVAKLAKLSGREVRVVDLHMGEMYLDLTKVNSTPSPDCATKVTREKTNPSSPTCSISCSRIQTL